MGIEPTALCLGSRCSTTELRPLPLHGVSIVGIRPPGCQRWRLSRVGGVLQFAALVKDHPDVGRHRGKSEQDSGSEDEHDQCWPRPLAVPDRLARLPQEPGCAQGLAEAPVWLLGTYRDGS